MCLTERRIYAMVNIYSRSSLQRNFSPFAVFLFLLFFIAPSWNHAGPRVKILYFFSMSCQDCIDVEPAIIALGKEYGIEGYNTGTTEARGYPFAVKMDDRKAAREVYGIKGIPSLAILVDGVFKQKIEGRSDIQDAKSIIKALSNGAMTVTEAAKMKMSAELTITGWVVAKGEYFKHVRFILTDRTTEIQVKAWLPLEAMKSPMKKAGPRLMSDVLRKPVVLKGRLTQTKSGGLFQVKEELPP